MAARDDCHELPREYAHVYRVAGKADVNAFIREAVRASGGRVLYESVHTRAPVFLGVQTEGDERLGMLLYPFRVTRNVTRNRPEDENKLQVRYGAEEKWHTQDHPLGFDPAHVDVTLVLGVHLDAGLLIGLDPLRYDPLPMGISIELKDAEIRAAQQAGWHVWERQVRAGSVRDARAPDGLETLVALRPERLLDYVRLEREATGLGLDPPLRYSAALAAGNPGARGPGEAVHVLEHDFDLSSKEILDIIEQRMRLAVAVRGGVAEHHLAKQLADDPAIARVDPVDRDGGDFEVEPHSARTVLVECKNASPTRYGDGAFRVEVQKTRASKGDPASRYYRVDQFDIVAACLFSPTRRWEFAYRRTDRLRRHSEFPERIAAMQRVDDAWSRTLVGALAEN